jgi:hypothetical protein
MSITRGWNRSAIETQRERSGCTAKSNMKKETTISLKESQGLGPTFKEGTPTAVLPVVERLPVNIVTKPASERYSALV